MLHQQTKSYTVMRFWPFVMVGIAMSFYLYEFILRVVPNAIFAELMKDFHLGAHELGTLSSLIFSCYALIQIPVGVWTDKFGPRRLLTLGILLCALSTLLFAWTESYFLVCVARILIGAGAAFAFICTLKIATDWFDAKYFSFIVGLTVTMGSLGAIFGVTVVAKLVETISWRELFVTLGWFGVVLALLAWFCLKDKKSAANDPLHTSLSHSGNITSDSLWVHLKRVMCRPQNWFIGVYGLLVTAPIDAVGGTWGAPFLVYSHGMSKVDAASVSSMVYFGMMIGGPVLGLFSDWWRNRTYVMGGFASIAAIAVGILFYVENLPVNLAYVLFFIFGFFGNFVLSFVVAREVNEPEYAATVVGFINCFANLGSWFVTWFIGAMLGLLWSKGPMDFLEGGVPLYTHSQFQLGLAIIPCCYIGAALLSYFMIQETFTKSKPT